VIIVIVAARVADSEQDPAVHAVASTSVAVIIAVIVAVIVAMIIAVIVAVIVAMIVAMIIAVIVTRAAPGSALSYEQCRGGRRRGHHPSCSSGAPP